VGTTLSTVGQERGVVTGRMRRCGWLDAAALKRSMIINGISGLCITKLDVLDGLPEIKIGTGYKLGGRTLDVLPLDADEIAELRADLRNPSGLDRDHGRADQLGAVAD
jgi:adenylosuccinate synthase